MSALPFVAFVEDVCGVRLTDAQRVLCRVAFDRAEPRDLEGSERELARLIFGEVEVVPASARAVLVALCGARSGKSFIVGALYSLWRALTADLSRLARGETAVALIAAPDLRLARQTKSYAHGAAKALPAVARLIINEGADAFTLKRPDGGLVAVECLPASRGGSALRGRSLVSAVLDEAAFFRDESAAVNDQELFRAASPRILPGGLLVVASTPWSESGLLHSEFTRNHGHPVTALAAHAPTLLMRANDPAVVEIVRREEQRDPENARREYGAQFAATSEALFDAQDIDTCVIEGQGDRERVPGVSYGFGLDLAVRHDFTVALVGHKELRRRDAGPPVEFLIVDLARHWAPEKTRKLDVDALEGELAAIAVRYRAKVDADGWAFDFLEARMRGRGIVCEQQSMAPAEQTRRASALAAAIRQHRVELPDNAELVRQLKLLRVTRSAGGHMRFAAPDRRGAHDDYAKALLLLSDRVSKLPPGGGDIRSEWRQGRRVWFRVETDGTRTPTLPPVGHRDWLDMCARSIRGGDFTTTEIEAWLAEPANREAVDRYIERQFASRTFSAFTNR